MKYYRKIIIAILIVAVIIGIVIVFVSLNNKAQSLYLLSKIYINGKHLVLFQNNAEIRPSGGFIGSFAVVETKNFMIKNIYFDANIYKRDFEFVYKNSYIPKDDVLKNFVPDGKLQMRDSNWSLDFSDAASEVAWFYEHEGGTKVNTVTAINTGFFQKILKIVGPIKMVKYNTEVNHENIYEVLHDEIEEKYTLSTQNEAVNEPKSIISEMLPIVISRLKNINKVNSVLNAVLESLTSKDIQLFSYNLDQEKQIDKKNWGGNIANNSSNYLYINNANLGGFKTSINISENIFYEIKTNTDGENIVVLTIQKKYPAMSECQFNKNFTRILIPQDSILLSAYRNDDDITKEVGISQEYNKQVFRLWTNINCNQQYSYKIIYKLPDNIFDSGRILNVQKQPGSVNQFISISSDNSQIYEGYFDRDFSVYLP